MQKCPRAWTPRPCALSFQVRQWDHLEGLGERVWCAETTAGYMGQSLSPGAGGQFLPEQRRVFHPESQGGNRGRRSEG